MSKKLLFLFILTLIITDKNLTDEEWEYYDSQATGFEKNFT